MNLGKLNITSTMLALILVGVGIIILGVLCVMQYNAMEEPRERSEEVEEIINEKEIELSRLMAIRQEAEEYERFLNLVKQLIPEEAAEDRLITSLQDLAMDAGVNFVRVNLGDHEEEENHMEIPLDLTFEGSFRSFLMTVEHLHYPRDGRRAFRVDSINLGPSQMDIYGAAFYQKEDVEPEEDEEAEEVDVDDAELEEDVGTDMEAEF